MVLERGSPFSIPSYLYKDLDIHVMRNFSRFRLRAHHLRVESCNWHGGSSICDKCECGEVQDEKHVLFFWKCAEVCELRMKYRDLFEGMFKTLNWKKHFKHEHAVQPRFWPFLCFFYPNTQKKRFGMIVVRVTLKTCCFPFLQTCSICFCQAVSPHIFGTKLKLSLYTRKIQLHPHRIIAC